MIRRWLFPPLAAVWLALPVAAAAQEAYTTRTANVRAGPDASYPVVAQLAPGYPVQVMGCLDDYRWCDVVFADNRGWLYAGNLSYPWQSSRVPILTYGPTLGLPIITFSLGNYWDRYYRGRPWYGNRNYWASRPVPHRQAGPPARAYPGRPYAQPGPDRNGQPWGDRPYRGRPDSDKRPNRPRVEGRPVGERPRPGPPEGRPSYNRAGVDQPAGGANRGGPMARPPSPSPTPGRGQEGGRPQPREAGRPGGEPRAQ